MGSYVNQHLIKDETVAFETKLHWVIFFSLKSIFTLTIYAWLKRWLSEFVITNRRIVIKEGFIARRTFEMNLSKIETVNVDQTVMGRYTKFRFNNDHRHRRHQGDVPQHRKADGLQESVSGTLLGPGFWFCYVFRVPRFL